MATAKIIALLISLLFILSQANYTFAQSKVFLNKSQLQQLGFNNYENINSNLIIYPFKRYWEDLYSLFIFNPQPKKQYTWKLYNKRFNELVYIINNEKTGFLLETVDRYNTFTGRLKAQNLDLKQSEKKQIKNNLLLIEKLRDRYHSGTPYWVKIQEAVDTTRSLI